MKAASKVIEIDDDTDLVKAAEFDFLAFLEKMN